MVLIESIANMIERSCCAVSLLLKNGYFVDDADTRRVTTHSWIKKLKAWSIVGALNWY